MGHGGLRQRPIHMVKGCWDAGLGPSLVSPRMGSGISLPYTELVQTRPLQRQDRLQGLGDRQPTPHTSSSTRTRDQRQRGRGSGSPRSQPLLTWLWEERAGLLLGQVTTDRAGTASLPHSRRERRDLYERPRPYTGRQPWAALQGCCPDQRGWQAQKALSRAGGCQPGQHLRAREMPHSV